MRNYSQNNEQEKILEFFSKRLTGTFIDIGANDGLSNSNTRALVEKGWTGYLVEPSPSAFKTLRENSDVYKGLICLNIAIGETNGPMEWFECSDTQTSTLNKDWSERVKQAGFTYNNQTVEVRTVEKIFSEVGLCDFLSIDAEGCDFGILKQFMNMNYKPTLISIECSGQERIEIQKYLQAHGYKLYHTTGENLLMNV